MRTHSELRHWATLPARAPRSVKPTAHLRAKSPAIPGLGELRHKVTNRLLSNPAYLWGFNSPSPLESVR